jgi:cell division protein FtsN
MPDLNLIEEGGFEEMPTPVAPPAKKKIKSSSGGGGGGGAKTILILLMILILCGAGVYFLNQRGIIKLWGKKKPLVTQVQEDEFSRPPVAPQDQTMETQSPLDTTMTLLEPSPVDETQKNLAEPAKPSKQSAKKPQAKKEKEEAAETESSSKLSEMQGEYTIQVIAYREKEQAVEISDNLEIAGYPSFVEKVPMKGGEWYTVRIGRYASPEEAKKAVQTFPEQLQAHYIIDKIRTK